MYLKSIVKSFRPSFLVLTPICIFLGVGTSLTIEAKINIFSVGLILIGALSAHICVNTLNEYFDFKSGLDLKTNKTKFSGGSGALPENPDSAGSVLAAGIICLVLTVSIGIYFVIESGPLILPIGIVGVFLLVAYTPWINRLPVFGLIASGLGFGVLMVVGTHIVLTGSYSHQSFLVSLVPFFLVNNLLLLNQYPDIEADSSVGRKTFPIVFGIQMSNYIYAFFVLSCFVLILVLIVLKQIPVLSVVALIPVILSLFALVGGVKHSSSIGEHPEYLGANVATTLLTPLLLGISIVLG